MDWIHCNTCGVQPCANFPVVFRLTSCGHIYCHHCENKEILHECKVCRNRDVTTIKLSSEMKPEIQVYFQDPEILASQLVKVIEFQKGHRMRFIQCLQKKGQKYNTVKAQVAKLDERLKREEEEKKKAIEQNKNLMRELDALKNTPGINSPSPVINLNRPLLQTNSRAAQLIKSAAEQVISDRNSQNYSRNFSMMNSPSSIYSTPNANYRDYRNSNISATPGTPLSTSSNSSFADTPASNFSNRSARSDRSFLNRSLNTRQPTPRSQSVRSVNSLLLERTPPNLNRLNINKVQPQQTVHLL